jgi:peptidyl-prolyl cis-trans isomerase SurA
MDELPPQVQQVISPLQAGQYTQPLRDAAGFTILQLEGKRAPGEKQIVTEYHARHLEIKPSATVTQQEAKDEIQKLYQEIVNDHASFATLAKRDSDDPTTANNGGDMGWFTQNEWGSDIGKLVATMQPGQVSQPFASQDGAWHIIQLVDTRQADKTQDIERAQAREAIGQRKGREAYDQFLRSIESSAYINIRVPALAGASPYSASDSTP